MTTPSQAISYTTAVMIFIFTFFIASVLGFSVFELDTITASVLNLTPDDNVFHLFVAIGPIVSMNAIFAFLVANSAFRFIDKFTFSGNEN